MNTYLALHISSSVEMLIQTQSLEHNRTFPRYLILEYNQFSDLKKHRI